MGGIAFQALFAAGTLGVGQAMPLTPLAFPGGVVLQPGGALAVARTVVVPLPLAGGVVITVAGPPVLNPLAQMATPPNDPGSNNPGSNAPQGGQPPRTLQTGGRTIRRSTADALGLDRHVVGEALEALKEDLGIPNNHHGRIMSNGDYVDAHSGNVLGNILEYVN
jgi:hypothetical protein